MTVYAVNKDHRRIADEAHGNMVRHHTWMKTEFAKVAQEQPSLERREQFRIVANRWLGNTLPPTPHRDQELKNWSLEELNCWNMFVDETSGIHRHKIGGVARLNKMAFDCAPKGSHYPHYIDTGLTPAPGLPN